MTETTETVELAPTLTAPEATQTAAEIVTPQVDAAEQTTDEATPEQSAQDDADKAKRSMQRRIDKRTADLYRERAQNEQLTQRLAALEARASGEPEQQAERIDPVALAREIAAVERITEKSNGIAKDGEKRFGGEFGPALVAVQEEAGALFQPSGKPTALGDAILDSDDPAALLHHLGKNPDLAADLQGLSAAQLGRRIGQIEARMTTPAPIKPVIRAPSPARPVAGSSSAGKSLSDMTMAEYKAARIAQGARFIR